MENQINTLVKIQSALKATKNKKNTFGNYNFRNVEGILEAVKPLLLANNCTIILKDEPVMVGERFYIKATATLTDHTDRQAIADGTAVTVNTESWESTAFARECVSKKGMDDAQLTGSCSSYARKYALSGLLAICNGEPCADQVNDKAEEKPKKAPAKAKAKKDAKPAETDAGSAEAEMEQQHRQNLRLELGSIIMNDDTGECKDIPYLLSEDLKTIADFHLWSCKNPLKGKIETFDMALKKCKKLLKLQESGSELDYEEVLTKAGA